jgi:hypothetical protein
MNIGAWMCGVLVISFAAIGLLFGLFKEKATKCVAGFNTFSEKEQAMYDRAAISLDIRNQCFWWSAIMLAGTVFSLVLSPYMAILAFIVWGILFFKDTHMDAHKAFEKYLLK